MANLAIKGHATRGREVIELLEMLGGKNIYKYRGDRKDLVYFINSDYYGSIDNDTESNIHSYKLYSLEEFLEKFPYKVRDKVYYNNRICSIIEMRWNGNLNTIRYGVDDRKIKNLALVEELKPYKEETMEGKIKNFEILESNCSNEIKIEFDPSKFEMVEKENGYYVVRKKPQYPKTYWECYKILNHLSDDDYVGGYKDDLLEQFQKLLICRDAYWKIAGEEMGLGKPWEPDWKDGEKNKYCIYNCNGGIHKSHLNLINVILAFPTEEMRNIFYENFKELIKQCRELL